MRNNFLSTPSKKASSVYQAVDEEQEEDDSWGSQRAELRDDDLPDSHYENFNPHPQEEAHKEEYDDPRRSSTVSPRVKLLLNREFVFQSSKLTFYNSLEMRLASPKTALPPGGVQNIPTSFLRPPSFTEGHREGNNEPDVNVPEVIQDVNVQKVDPDVHVPKVVQNPKVQKVAQEVNVPKVFEEVEIPRMVQDVKVPRVVPDGKVQRVVQDVPDTMSVTSLFYDDYSTTAHTRTGVEVDVVHEYDDEREMDACSVGQSIFSRGRELIHKTGSVETSFPEDPNKWLDDSSVVGEEHLVTSATIESREVDPINENDDVDTFLDQLVAPTVSEGEGSYHNQSRNQLVWQSHDQTETLTETAGVFVKSNRSGRSHDSLFDDLNENEDDTDEHGNDIPIDQLFPSDPLWTMRCEMEKQEMVNNDSNDVDDGQSYGEPEDPFAKDPFFVPSTHENGHSNHDSNIVSSPKRKEPVSPSKVSVAEFQAPLSLVDVGYKDTDMTRVDGNQDHKGAAPGERRSVVGAAKNPFDVMAFNPFVGTQDEDEEDDTAADVGYSRDEESYALDHLDHEILHAPEDGNDPTRQEEVPPQVTNPFESYDDESLLDIVNKSRDTNDSDDPIVVDAGEKVIANYINPFDDLSIDERNASDATKTTVPSYINPFDDDADERHVSENQTPHGTVKKSTNPFDTFDDDLSIDRNSNLPLDPVMNSQIVTVDNDDDIDVKQIIDKIPEEQDHKKSRSFIKGAKASNLYTMVMMSSGKTRKDSKTKQPSLSDPTVLPEDITVESKDESSKMDQKSTNNNSKRNEARPVLPASSSKDDNLGVDDIFNQALLPPSTQEGPLVDSDDDDCYIEDDDHNGVDSESDLSDNSDPYEDGGDAVYDDEESNGQRGESWQSHLYLSEPSDTRNNQDVSVQGVTPVGDSNNDVPGTTRDVPKHLPKLDDDEISIDSDRDAYDAFMRDTGKSHYDPMASVEESDQQTFFDEEAHPDSEALSCYDDDDDAQTYGDDGTVSGLKVLGCLHCSALEEEMMILKAQHQTELLERDLQDEEVLNNMMLMREYIEHLESDQSVTRHSQQSFSESRSRSNSVTECRSRSNSIIEVDIGRSLSEVTKEIEEKSTNFQLFELKARVRFLEDENRRLKDEQIHTATKDTQTLMIRIRELENEREENLKTLAINDQLKSRIQELENQLEKSKSETDQELKRRIQDLEAKLDLSQQETRDDLKHQIDELVEERDLLCTKIEAQEASVALMTQEEEELKKLVQRLENELQLVKLERDSDNWGRPKEQLPTGTFV